MDVRIEAQRRGIVHAVPRPGSGRQLSARGEAAAQSDPQPQPSPSGTPAASSRATSAAWFDANRDGVIESWSIAHGGDSFADFTPPPSGSAGSNTRRPSESTPGVASWGPGPDQSKSRGGTAAAVHHAHDAYRRDGLSHAPSPRATAGPTPAKTAPPSLPGGRRPTA